jgi:hypothetical protein
MATVQDLDVIVEPRYDTTTLPAAGALALTFFAVPLNAGQSSFGAAGIAKSLADTNMDLAAQLPAGYNFLITGFRVQPVFTLTPIDARQWSMGGWFTFSIGSKPFLRTPLDTIPAGAGPFGYGGATVDTVNRAMSHGVPTLSNSFGVGRKPFLLEQTANFGVLLNWTALQPVTTIVPVIVQVTVGMPLRVYMDGILRRRVQ